MSYQSVTGPLMANSHPGSYCGQDAYSDMFVTERKNENELGWHTDSTNIDSKQCRRQSEDAGQRKLQCDYRGGTELETVVRRLTPMECERLQGFPDGWTDIGEWTDTKGKLHKESSDSARYKALGNSIALPPWMFVLQRLSLACGPDHTMASLFDGIGGYPLIWELFHGKGSCRWASEIEEFPMAVTKQHFQKEA